MAYRTVILKLLLLWSKSSIIDYQLSICIFLYAPYFQYIGTTTSLAASSNLWNFRRPGTFTISTHLLDLYSVIMTTTVAIETARRVIATLPLSARTNQNTNSPSFHVMKLPGLEGNADRLRQLAVEYCIQPLGTESRQAIWWTSYVFVATRGTLTRGSGVYTDWNEFGSVISHPPTAIIAPRTSGIVINDIAKGVLNGNQTNGTVSRVIDLSGTSRNLEVFAVLVASGMHDGAYQVHGQARLEYAIRGND